MEQEIRTCFEFEGLQGELEFKRCFELSRLCRDKLLATLIPVRVSILSQENKDKDRANGEALRMNKQFYKYGDNYLIKLTANQPVTMFIATMVVENARQKRGRASGANEWGMDKRIEKKPEQVQLLQRRLSITKKHLAVTVPCTRH